jgi:hypothetical protein
LKNGINSFQPIVIDDNDWPYEKTMLKVKINSDLLDLSLKFCHQYSANKKDHVIIWNPLIGKVTLNIKFKSNTKKAFTLNTCMANIILHLKKKDSFKLSEFLCESGYKHDEIEKSIQALF